MVWMRVVPQERAVDGVGCQVSVVVLDDDNAFFRQGDQVGRHEVLRFRQSSQQVAVYRVNQHRSTFQDEF